MLETFYGLFSGEKPLEGKATLSPISSISSQEAKTLKIKDAKLSQEQLISFQHVVKISFHSCWMNTKSLSQFLKVKKETLHSLKIHNCTGINMRDVWDVLAIMDNLKELYLSGDPFFLGITPKKFLEEKGEIIEIFDVTLPYQPYDFKTPMPKLRKICYPSISDTAMKNIANSSKRLQSIATSQSIVSGEGLKALINGCGNLQHISFHQVQFTNPEILANIRSLSLKKLELIECHGKEEGLNPSEVIPLLDKNPQVQLNMKRVIPIEKIPIPENPGLHLIEEFSCGQINLPSFVGNRLIYLKENGWVVEFDLEKGTENKLAPTPGKNTDKCQAYKDTAIVASSISPGIYLIDLPKKSSRTLYAGTGTTKDLLINEKWAIYSTEGTGGKFSISCYDIQNKKSRRIDTDPTKFQQAEVAVGTTSAFLNDDTLAVLGWQPIENKGQSIILIIDLKNFEIINEIYPPPAGISMDKGTNFVVATGDKDTPLATVTFNGDITFWNIKTGKKVTGYQTGEVPFVGLEVMDKETIKYVSLTNLAKGDAFFGTLDRTTGETTEKIPFNMGGFEVFTCANFSLKQNSSFAVLPWYFSKGQSLRKIFLYKSN